VIVVGAGLAGLHAALRLEEAGLDVVVLEARDRVGGRTWSHELPDGSIVERGGEFIAPGDAVLHGLAAELGLELVPHGFSFDRRPAPGRDAPTAAELAAVAEWAGANAARLEEDVPAVDALPPEPEWSPVQADVLRRLETSLTLPLSEVSARRTLTGEIERYDPADRVRGGNQAVAVELARRLQGRVRLETPVVAVRDTEVVSAGGERFDAAAVVLALPLPLLLELRMEPGLPEAVRAAIARTRFGEAAKLHVPLAGRPEPGAMSAPDSRWWCWTSRAADHGSLAAPVLSCFAGGAAAVGAITAEGARALRPHLVPADAEHLLTRWGDERWTRGSYSLPGVGLTAEHGAAWTRPWGSVAFAGEHTAGELSGTMNGAAASGARAASTVLELLGARSGGRG
jgi:monoamine oxidase